MPAKLILIIVALFIFQSCAAPINQRNAEKYYAAAVSAQHSGDWWNSRKYFARAISNAELAGAPSKGLAVLWYEYGRSSGVICDWEEAENGLNKAFELDSKIGGPAYMSLYELAQMNYARELYTAAIEYFQGAYSGMEEDQADTKDPIGYADFLDKYIHALEQAGRNDLVPQLSARSEKIRAAFTGKESHTEQTPYGTLCQAGS